MKEEGGGEEGGWGRYWLDVDLKTSLGSTHSLVNRVSSSLLISSFDTKSSKVFIGSISFQCPSNSRLI